MTLLKIKCDNPKEIYRGTEETYNVKFIANKTSKDD